MTPRERLLKVLAGGIPDCVPVMPDLSNMVPCLLTGKPFWQIYLYHDPPLTDAYIDCAKHFDIDSLWDGCAVVFPEERTPGPDWETFIVFRGPERIVTQAAHLDNGQRVWAPTVDVYYVADPPTRLAPERIGLPPTPARWEPLEGVQPVDDGPAALQRIKERMGDQGLVGIWGGAATCVLGGPEWIYDYYENPARHEADVERRVAFAEQRFERIMRMEVKPDFLYIGGSGSLIWQTPEIFRKLALPPVKRVAELARKAGLPTHVHSCGPEKELVRMLAEETELTVIDPLEPPPMGDCDLAELKRLYGHKLVLKGNLHTTDVMLRGSVARVIAASRAAIDDAAAGGRFILSTGDQCGRDTPEANLRAMIETARTYGRYGRS